MRVGILVTKHNICVGRIGVRLGEHGTAGGWVGGEWEGGMRTILHAGDEAVHHFHLFIHFRRFKLA